ncbi:MAG: hypothetical protein ACLRX7_08920 [Acutalibacteraceae bacterium]
MLVSGMSDFKPGEEYLMLWYTSALCVNCVPDGHWPIVFAILRRFCESDPD